MRYRTLLVACVAGALCTAAASAQSAPENGGVFSEEILPLLQESFAPLLERESGLDLTSWESLMEGSDHGEVVIPFDPKGSLLIKLVTQPG